MNSTQDQAVVDNLMIPADCRAPVQLECCIAMWIWRTLPVLLLAISACGNTLCVIVLARKTLRVNSTNIFLLCLAVSDMSFMFASVSRQSILRGIGFDIRSTSSVMCKVHTWMTHVSAGYSGWLLCLVTVDRVIKIVWPIFAREKLTYRKAVVACLVLLSIMLASNAHLLYDSDVLEMSVASEVGNGTTHLNHTKLVCHRIPNSILSKTIRKVIDVAVFNALPAFLLVIGNAIIAMSLLKQAKHRLLKIQQGNQTTSAFAKKQAAVAKMLMMVCAFSLISTLPQSVFAAVVTTTDIVGSLDERGEARLQLAYALFGSMFYCAFSFNFLIYVMRGSLFKEEFKSLVTSLRNVFGL